EKVSGVLDEEAGVPEPADPVSLTSAKGALHLQGVSFGYRESLVLEDLDLHLPAGQVLALVGQTGAGKSTLARLVARFYDPVGGRSFISALPQGYDTDVRRRGVRLSSGQRQLVAFARAFLADPAVLILDEATSSLDLPTERLVQRALRTLLRGRTAIIIAHRLSTVEIADRVLVIDGGRIVEDGDPAALRRSAGRYGSLH